MMGLRQIFVSPCRRGGRSGAAMVEMALVLPVFFTVVLGIFEFGRAMMASNMITNAAREGARISILDGSTNTDVQNAINDFLTGSLGVSSSVITTSITITPATGNADPGGQVGNCHSRDLVKIKVTIPFDKVSLIPGTYLAGKTLSGQAAMRHE